MLKLTDVYEKYKMNDCGGDKGTLHSYIPIYEEYFQNKRKNISLLEIGVFKGHSVKMWEEYFENSEVVGIDVDLKNFEFSKNGITLYECDVTDEQKIHTIFEGRSFDFIIDDGSHLLSHQVQAFKILFPYLKNGGVYFIEDIFNIDKDREIFQSLHKNLKIVDLRSQKNRFDDVLAIIQK